MKLFFVIPIYNEAPTVRPLAEAILAHTRRHEARILFVDDGSTDNSLEKLRALERDLEEVDLLVMPENRGKTAALDAGFARAEGDVVFTLDGDLQDDPAEIPRFLDKLAEGNDLVIGWKKKRHDPLGKTFPSRIYNGVINFLFGTNLHDINSGFKAVRTEVLEHVPLFGDMHRLIPVFVHSAGYRVAEIPVQHHARKHGRSKYGPMRFITGGADMLGVWVMLGLGRRTAWLLALVSLLLAVAWAFFVGALARQEEASPVLLVLGVIILIALLKPLGLPVLLMRVERQRTRKKPPPESTT